MVENQNTDIPNRIAEDTKLSPQFIPSKINENIQPVLISNPRENATIVRSGTAVNTTTTLYTTPTTGDFYLTGFNISNNNTGNANAYMTITIDGNTQTIGTMRGCVGGYAQNLTNPIKVDKNTSITITSNNALGVTGACIFGFLVKK